MYGQILLRTIIKGTVQCRNCFHRSIPFHITVKRMFSYLIFAHSLLSEKKEKGLVMFCSKVVLLDQVWCYSSYKIRSIVSGRRCCVPRGGTSGARASSRHFSWSRGRSYYCARGERLVMNYSFFVVCDLNTLHAKSVVLLKVNSVLIRQPQVKILEFREGF